MDLIIRHAYQYLGKPYIYGDKNGIDGFDCSGFVYTLLRGCGAIPHGEYNAQMIFNYYDKMGRNTILAPQAGSLSFYGESVTKIDHVVFHIDRYRVIEAAGGDSTTLTKEDALKRPNAAVRIMPLKYRPDYIISINPDYACIGLIRP